jgi:hypothetical protein
MHHTWSIVGGASLGAGLMYFLDPDRGRRRRALMRNKSIRWSRKTREFAGSTSRDMRNRAQGMGTAVKSWVQPAPPVPDNVLAERIRSKLGLFSRHPSAIDVHVTDGTVTISGPVLQDEVDGICGAIDKIPGVNRIFNRLEPHTSPEGVPALQGPVERKPGPRFALMQSHWSPTARMAAAIMGTAALLYGLNQRSVSAATLAASGLGLLIRSATNEEFSRLFNFKIGTIGGL